MRTNVIDRVSVSSRQFTYSSESSRFIAEASDLRGIDFLGPIYNDACDRGFYMKSSKSGKVVLFVCDGQFEAGEETDGEVGGWTYSCATRGYQGLKATIFND